MSQVYTAREIEAIRSAARQKGVLEGHDIGRAEGYRAGLEAAAKECDMRSRAGGTYAVEQAACEEARDCAAAIRALAKEA